MVSLGEKNLNILLLAKTVIIELKHYVLCFQNRVLMWRLVMEKLNGYIYIFIEDNELLETYNGIWNKVSNSIKKKILKTKIRSCGDKPAYIHDK